MTFAATAAIVGLCARPLQARETRPYFDLAFGIGLGAHNVALADRSRHQLWGSTFLVEGRLLLPANQGVGLRLGYLDAVDLFGESSETVLNAAIGYVIRAEPRRDFHPVPALFVGPMLSSVNPAQASEPPPVCPLGCEPPPLQATPHAALGLAAAFSLDLHGDVLFGGLDIMWHYGFPLEDRDIQTAGWSFALGLRFGATIFPGRARKPRARP